MAKSESLYSSGIFIDKTNIILINRESNKTYIQIYSDFAEGIIFNNDLIYQGHF